MAAKRFSLFFLPPPEKPIPGGVWTSVDVCSSGRDVFAIHFRQTIINKSACPKRFFVWEGERPRVGLSFFTVSALAETRVAGRPSGALTFAIRQM
jgi:hypothetical protein